MKNITKLTKKINSNYKIYALITFILSLIALIIFKNDNLDNYIKTILISISINLMSSIIIVILIDINKEMNSAKELYNKRKVLLRRIVNPINKFEIFIINAYKSTVTKSEFEKFELDENNISVIMSNLEKMNNEKNGYSLNFNLKRFLVWKELFVTQIMEYIDNMLEFYNSQSYILPNDLNNYIYNIISADVNRSNWGFILMPNSKISTKDLLEVTSFKKILKNTLNIKKVLVEKYEFGDYFNIRSSMFIRKDMLPDFKSSI